MGRRPGRDRGALRLNAAPRSPLDALLAGCPALARSLAGIERAAAVDAPLLLVGEAGSGCSTVARAVHRASRRASEELVELDPGSVPASLLESELFGHRVGAYTGADVASEGKVKRAGGGTLLLDHVESLPLASQPKLLRLLSEGVYAPLGGRDEHADVRVVSIGREDLRERVAAGRFRSDLFFRLEVLAFRVPPLRERREDLPAIVDALLADLAERLGVPSPPLAEGALDWMQRYAWPGNLRQLRNLLERSLVLDPAGPLAPEPPSGPLGDRPRTLLEVERQEIEKALAYTKGHQGRAAELLGISRKALWEKRKRLGIP